MTRMRIVAALLLSLALVSPALAESDLDGSCWQVKNQGWFGSHDRVTFWKGQFIRRSAVRSGGRPVVYECRREGEGYVWTASELADTGGKRVWQGVWDGRTAVMRGSYSYLAADGRVKSRAWSARRFAD